MDGRGPLEVDGVGGCEEATTAGDLALADPGRPPWSWRLAAAALCCWLLRCSRREEFRWHIVPRRTNMDIICWGPLMKKFVWGRREKKEAGGGREKEKDRGSELSLNCLWVFLSLFISLCLLNVPVGYIARRCYVPSS